MENETNQTLQNQTENIRPTNHDLPNNLNKNNKYLTIILLIIILVSVTVATFFGYKYFQLLNEIKIAKVMENKNLKLEDAPNPSVVSNSSAMEDWKTYENLSLGFRIKYPALTVIEKEIDDNNSRFVAFSGHDLKFEIMLRSNPGTITLDNYFYMDSPVSRKITFLGKSANVYELSNGYCDGPGCNYPLITIVIENNFELFHISFIGDTELSKLEEQILGTFEFIDDKDVVFKENNDPKKVVNDYLTAYVNKDWVKAKEICPSLDEKIAEGYGFTKFEVTGFIPNETGGYYAYVKFINDKGEIFDRAPHSNNPLQILVSKDEEGIWKVLTWYFYE